MVHPNRGKEVVLPNPNVFNLNKYSLGTIGFGLTKFDCSSVTKKFPVSHYPYHLRANEKII